MLRHTILLIYRNAKRFKSTFFINLIGLSTGLACTLLIYLWVNDELSIDKFLENDNRIFQVLEHMQYAEGIQTAISTPGLLAETLAKEISQIEYAASTADRDNYTLSINEKNIKAVGQYVGLDFFKIFSYPLIQGNRDKVLSDKNSIVISETLARKLFQTAENGFGKSVIFQHGREFQSDKMFERRMKVRGMKYEESGNEEHISVPPTLKHATFHALSRSLPGHLDPKAHVAT